jgi:uncharacterized protein (TIGR03118 family)
MKFKNPVAAAVLVTTCLTFPAAGQTNNAYITTNLVANTAGVAPVVDPNLVDPWGISISTSSPFWVSNHLSGTSTLYNGSGAITAVVVIIPKGSASPAGALGRPTGQVQNNLSATFPSAFLLPAPNGKVSSFIFCTDDGTISAWNGSVTASTAVVTADNSGAGAVYKGMAIGTSAQGATLYAANFRSGKIDVFNGNWAPVTLAGSFTDPAVPAGFAPFNIWNLNNRLYVTYAKQDANKFLDVAGPGNGYVAVFDLNGNLISHLVSNGALNSPWGVAIAPPSWGAFGGDLLVANFGDGRINAYNTNLGFYAGALQDTNGNPITISGLWAIIFGNGKSGGDARTLYFAAGQPNGSSVPRGIIGSIAPPASIVSVVNAASELPGPVAPGEIVVLSGQTTGPSPSLTSVIPASGSSLPTTSGGTKVTFNGTAAPIVYAGSGATSVQVPYSVAGSTTASVVLTVGNQTTPAFNVQVAPTAPALFTSDFTGGNTAVALNADGTVNTPSNPALQGSQISVFVNGAGVTVPADTAGIVEADSSRVPVAPISVKIGGSAATVVSSGSLPKSVSGIIQVTATVPTGITPGAAPVVVTAGGVSTTQTVTVFVK